MKRKRYVTTARLGSALLLGGVLAGMGAARAAVTESDFFDELPVVLSASRLSQPQNAAPAAVTVIDQAMIQASGFRDIPDLFRLVPGFTVAYTRDNTWGVGYHGLADAYSRRMQVLIDGRSVYTAAFGEVPWGSLPLSIDDIERIEVVRGPNSAAYGSNAFFGIINIITKDAAQVSGQRVSAQAGNQNMAGVSFRHGGGDADLRYRLTLSDQRRDRFSTQAEETTTRLMDLRLDYRLSPTDQFSGTVAVSRGDWRHGVAGDIADPVRRADVGSEHVQAKFSRTFDAENEWFVQFYHTRLRNEDAVAVPGLAPVNLGYMQWRDDLEFQMITQPHDSVRVVWGAEARWEGVKASGYFYNQDARSGALYRLFGNAEWHLSEQWIVNAGGMAEHHYLSGFDLSPRLAVNYLPVPDHAFRASITQAYRSPTFFETDGDYRIFTAGGALFRHVFEPSDGLRPERITSRELGYVGHIRPLRLHVDTRLFSDRVTRLIDTYDDPLIPGKLFSFTNQYGADIRGLDLQLRWTPRAWVDLVVSYARVNIDSEGEDIPQSAPEHNFSVLGIIRPAPGWEASLGIYRVGAMYWIGDGDATEAYTRVDARLARRWALGGVPLELALVGQNLGGDPYEEFRDDNLFDRRAYLSLTIDW